MQTHENQGLFGKGLFYVNQRFNKPKNALEKKLHFPENNVASLNTIK